MGDGHIPLQMLIERVVACGYTGDYVLEIFSENVADSLWQDKDTLHRAVTLSSEKFAAIARAIRTA